MSFFKKSILALERKPRLDEGANGNAQLYYYWHHPNNGVHNGGTGIASPGDPQKNQTHSQPESEVDSVGVAGEESSERVETMRNWHDKQMKDVAHMRGAYGGASVAGLQRFAVGDRVESNSQVIFAEAEIPALVKGVVEAVSAEGVPTVDFGRYGKHSIPHRVASTSLTVQQGDNLRSMLRESIGWKPESSFKPGQRARDDRGVQYTIERTDIHGHAVQVLDENGKQYMLSTEQLTALSPDEPFASRIHENLQSQPLNPGQFVTVTGVDPAFNQWRTLGVPANESEGYIGQRGLLEFAFYPLNGVRMYRVLFTRGGRRDFSESELLAAEG